MSLQELKEQACQLPANERLELIRILIEFLQDVPSQQPELAYHQTDERFVENRPTRAN